jgi:aminoglycoside phosphotransferase
LEFDHHWLFSQEDAIARRLRNLHSIYVDLCERLVQMFKEYAELKQRVEIEVVGEEEQTR